MRRHLTWSAVMAGAAVLTWGLWPPPRPNILLITVDALRPDVLSCYGGRRGATPHLDAIAKRGVLFTQAECDVPWTRGSLASVMTGRYATTHRMRSYFDRLPLDAVTMAEVFQRAGY